MRKTILLLLIIINLKKKKKILDAKIKQKKLVDQSDISNFNNSDLNTKLATLATKAE